MNLKKIIHKIISKIIYLILIIINKITLYTLDNLLQILNIFIVFLREDRIGHQAGNADVEFFKANLRKKRNNSKTIFIFPFPENKIANQYLRFKLVNFVNLKFHKAIILKYNFINILFSNLLIYSLPIILDSCKNIYYSETDVGKRLSNNILRNNNISIFNDLGIKKENYICIYARDNNYLNKLDPKTNWFYHQYRNSNIDNLRILSEYINEKQKWHVVRIGSSPKNRISWGNNKNNKIIDYPFSGFRSDKNDIDLISNCKLFISNGGGPESVAIAARREIIKINQVPLGDQHGNDFGIWLPKLHLKNKTSNYLSLIEICELSLASTLNVNGYNFEKLGISLKENSPSDILNLFLDYLKFKNNSFSKEEENLINEYNKIRKIMFSRWGILNYKKNFIAPSFLKKYNNLLDY